MLETLLYVPATVYTDKYCRLQRVAGFKFKMSECLCCVILWEALGVQPLPPNPFIWYSINSLASIRSFSRYGGSALISFGEKLIWNRPNNMLEDNSNSLARGREKKPNTMRWYAELRN